MAKNYATIYASENPASAQDQGFFIKLESSRGQFAYPEATDFFYTLPGGSMTYNQPFESSPQRSGRHHTDIIKKKKEMSWSFSTYFNIDESLGAASSAQIDPAIRLLWKSLLGYEDTSSGAVYDSRTDPSVSFSMYEVAAKWSRQAAGCFVQGGNVSLPGSGEAMVEWSGAGKQAYLVGIAQSTADNDGGNTITLEAGDEDEIPVGAVVMIIEADGTTRSADTPDGSPRVITAKTGSVVTVSGAALADADGSGVGAPIYVCYYEPAARTAINNPVTGLQGSFTLAGLTDQCVRNASINIQNNHELVNYCYAKDSLSNELFVAAERVTIEATIEFNLNSQILRLFNRVQNFEAQDITIGLGVPTGRRVEFDIPKVRFPVPAWTVPDSGSIPVSFSGTANQTALDAADELTVSFK